MVVGISLLGAQVVAFVLTPLLALRRRVPPIQPPQTSPVTIQILSWDGRHLLEEFLPSVLEAAGGNEVLVVDNGSTDDSVEFLKNRFPKVRVVQLDRNYGFSGGNNRGMKHVTTDIVVFLNNDMAVDRGFLDPLLKPFSDPAVFAVASRRLPWRIPQNPGLKRVRLAGVLNPGLFYVWHDEIDPQEEKREVLPVFWAGGGACAIDRR